MAEHCIFSAPFLSLGCAMAYTLHCLKHEGASLGVLLETLSTSCVLEGILSSRNMVIHVHKAVSETRCPYV